VAKFEITYRPSVAKDTVGIPSHDLKRILEKINLLAEDPRPPGSSKLSGKDYYRIRQGDYRIVYEIVENRLVVVVIKIGHRREVYR
jgi:mRNA interferase RelE/StbE